MAAKAADGVAPATDEQGQGQDQVAPGEEDGRKPSTQWTFEEWLAFRQELLEATDWENSQWKHVTDYLSEQAEHQRWPTFESPELSSDPLTPNRALSPQAQEIEMLAIKQFRKSLKSRPLR